MGWTGDPSPPLAALQPALNIPIAIAASCFW
jgi:hypothetical protein